jgi:hypothetical protein
MKPQTWITLVATIATCQIPLSLAGQERGNGGGAWICRENDNAIRWAELVDLYEGKVEFNLTIPKPFDLTMDQQLRAVEEKINQAAPDVFLVYEFYRDEVKKAARMLSNARLEVVDDALYRLLPLEESCMEGHLTYEQVANYTNYGVILINQRIYDKLTATDQAALWVHEAIYKMFRETRSDQNSVRTRELIAHLFSTTDVNDYAPILGGTPTDSSYILPDQFAIAPRFSDAQSFSEGLAPVKIGTKWGYINPVGQLVIKAQFEDAAQFSEGLAAVKTGGKVGFINPKGEWVIAPKFLQVGAFKEGMAIFSTNNTSSHPAYGFINRSGHIVIPEVHKKISSFSDGFAMMIEPTSLAYSFINKQGQLAFGRHFEEVKPFSEGMAAVNVNGKWGYIDTSGQMVIKPQFESVRSFHEGLAFVQNKEFFGLKRRTSAIDNMGRVVFDLDIDCFLSKTENPEDGEFCISNFYDGLALWNSPWSLPLAYVDHKGAIALHPPLGIITLGIFREEVAVFEAAEKYGVMDKTGQIIVEPKFDAIGVSREGLLLVKVKDHYGYIRNPMYKPSVQK